jgi:multidrug efflux pump subunit AcrB
MWSISSRSLCLAGVSKFLFSALALAFCLSLLASFVVAMTVIPLFCSKFLKASPISTTRAKSEDQSHGNGFNAWFNRMFNRVLDFYERWVRRSLERPALLWRC